MNQLDRFITQLFTQHTYDKDTIGLEFEVEGEPIGAFVTSIWDCKPDHSLRNGGLEWVTKKPVLISRIPSIIQEWFKYAANHNTKPVESLRTSIHVHINAQHYTLRQLYTIITAYWLLESLLVNYAGPDRRGNLFCLRILDADQTLTALQEGLNTGDYFYTTHGNAHKYAALNLAAISRYGSFEFRMMRGKYNDPNFIIEWVDQLWSMVNYASSLDSPKTVTRLFKANGPVQFIRHFFSSDFVLKLLHESPNFEADMEEAFHYSFELANTLEDWNTSIEPKKKALSKKKTNPYQFAALQDSSLNWTTNTSVQAEEPEVPFDEPATTDPPNTNTNTATYFVDHPNSYQSYILSINNHYTHNIPFPTYQSWYSWWIERHPNG